MSTYDISLARPRVLSDFVAPSLRARSALLIAGGAAFVGLCAQVSIPLPGTPVPLTLQTFAVLLTGAALGSRQGAASLALYLLAGGLGLPWFAHGGSGWGGPTLGYVVGFLLAAGLVGWLAERRADRTPVSTALTMLAGTVVVYAVGVPWLAAARNVPLITAWRAGAVPFLVGDLLKVLLAAGLLPAAWLVARRR